MIKIFATYLGCCYICIKQVTKKIVLLTFAYTL